MDLPWPRSQVSTLYKVSERPDRCRPIHLSFMPEQPFQLELSVLTWNQYVLEDDEQPDFSVPDVGIPCGFS